MKSLELSKMWAQVPQSIVVAQTGCQPSTKVCNKKIAPAAYHRKDFFQFRFGGCKWNAFHKQLVLLKAGSELQ